MTDRIINFITGFIIPVIGTYIASVCFYAHCTGEWKWDLLELKENSKQ